MLLFAALLLAGACGKPKQLQDITAALGGASRNTASGGELPRPSPDNNFNTDGYVAGTHYYDDWFNVWFKSGAKQAFTAAPQDLSGYDAQSVLVNNPQFGALAREIRSRYGIRLTVEVYVDGMNFAAFSTLDGSDARPVMERILADYAKQVEYVEYSARVRPLYRPNDLWQWNIEKINCETAWDHERGDPNVKVAVIDSGVKYSADNDGGSPNHEDLAANCINPITAYPTEYFDLWDRYYGGGNWKAPDDEHGHGTHVSGTIAAVGDNSRGVVGVAYQCKIVPIRVFGPTASGCPAAMVAAALVLAVDKASAQVVNMSLGSEFDDSSLRNACTYAYGKGSFLVAAAGNDDVSTYQYPAAYSNVLSVGATTTTDSRADYSNYGSWVSIAAPGGEYPPDDGMIASCGHQATNQYILMQGTSMACPHVAGAAALLKSYAPTLTNTQVRDLLIQNGPLLPSAQWSNTSIRRLDVFAALTPIMRPQVRFPEPSPMILTGGADIIPDIVENALSIDYYLDGVFQTKVNGAPWGFSCNTSGISFGNISVRAVAEGTLPELGSETLLSYIVDNTPGAYPVVYHFEGANETLPFWASDITGGFKKLSGGFNSGNSFGVYNTTAPNYPNSLKSFAVLPRLKLPASPAPAPTLTFRTHYNLENGKDIASVWVSTDNFQSDWTLLNLRSGDPARLTGFESDWVSTHVRLAAYAGQTVSVGFMLQTDGSGCGQSTSMPAGWWIDQVVVASNWAESVPFITSTGIATPANYGTVYSKGQITGTVAASNSPVKVRYELTTGGAPISGEIAAPYELNLDVSTLGNQAAMLELQAFDANGVGSPVVQIPIFIFNLRGDVNGDRLVNSLDRDALVPLLGLRSADAGFLPWADANLSGRIDEADLAAIGYFWGSTI